MKHPFIAWLLSVLLYGCLSLVLAASPADSRVLTTSPDHPRTFWTSGFEERDKYVQWNADAGALEAHVVYGTPSYTDSWNPALYDHFKASFPNVHLDARAGRTAQTRSHHRAPGTGRHWEPR